MRNSCIYHVLRGEGAACAAWDVSKATPTPDTIQHTIRVPTTLESRVQRVMDLEGLRTYNDFVLSALTRRCRDLEREHGIDSTGRRLPPTQ